MNDGNRTLPIRFTGSGSEYFRIWIVNMLLIVVTIGLYVPFAKARRIRYFYSNTQIDGQALSFHGDAWKMFRGYILLVVLMASYAIAGRLSPYAALPAFIVLCAVWPALWRASMQFRLANTGWRGLRMSFVGGLKAAYGAVAVLYLPLIVFVAITLFLPQGEDAEDRAAQSAIGIWLLLAMAVLALASPWFMTLTKRYQHNGYRLARQQAHITLPVKGVYGIYARCGLIVLALMAAVGGLGALLVATLSASGQRGAGAWVFPLLLVGFYLLFFTLASSYVVARLQNLVWNGTRSEGVAFSSELKFAELFWLTLKNWTLTALTLGLYRPFAAVNTARLRLQVVSVTIAGDVESWLADARPDHADATGDAAGDFFGIDMGL